MDRMALARNISLLGASDNLFIYQVPVDVVFYAVYPVQGMGISARVPNTGTRSQCDVLLFTMPLSSVPLSGVDTI